MPEMSKALFLVGPTATGKSAVAQRIAEQRGYDILSADSMLVYRGMDIGTAKPSRADRTRVRYWGVDLVAPGEPFSVARFLETASEAVCGARRAGRELIVVGGTGLYVKTLIHGLAPGPAVSPAARERWQALLEAEGVTALQDALRARSPRWLEALDDPWNGRRLIRALEYVEAGIVEPPRSWNESECMPEIVGLTAPRDAMEARIRARVDAMYAAGLLDEVRALLGQSDFARWMTASQAIGYAEAAACVSGHITEAEARERTAIRTRQLAKRQMTWFRRQCRVRWIDCGDNPGADVLAERVQCAWATTGPTALAV